MAGESFFDPAASSVMVAPGGADDSANKPLLDPAAGSPLDAKPVLQTPFKQVPSAEHGEGSLWGRVTGFLRSVDEGAGFDTTQASGTRPPPPSEHPWATTIGEALGKAAGITGAVTKGLSSGLSDRLDRGLGDPNQAAQDRFAARNPGLQTGGEIVGSIPTAALADAALAAKLIPPATRGGLVGGALDIGGQAARGGVIGGAAGAGMNEQDPGSGALMGAAAGAAIPLGLGMIGAVGRPVIDAAAARLSPALARQQAAAKIAQAFNRDMITADEARTQLAALGPEGALVDAGGANVTGLGESVASVPGRSKQIATTFLDTRAEGAPGRINDAINAGTGNTANFYGTMDALMKQRATAAAPLYEGPQGAFTRIIPTPEEAASVQRFIADPIGQEALDKGIRVIQLEKLKTGEAFNPADYGVTSDDNGRFVLAGGTPNLRLMDAVKRGYDGIVQGLKDANNGKLNEMGRAIDGARYAYVSALRDMYPRYGSALDAWGGPSQSIGALNMGRDILTEDPEVTAAAIGKLSDSDKDFFRSGVARALKDRVDATQEGADATRKIFGNDLIRQKIRAGFDNDAAFDQFRAVMENENTFAQTRNEVLRGSQTARRQAGQQDLDLATPTALVASGHPLPAALSLLRQGARANPPMDTDPVKSAIATLLFGGAPQNEYLAGLQAAQRRLMTPFVRVPAGITGAVAAAQPSDEQRRRSGLLAQ